MHSSHTSSVHQAKDTTATDTLWLQRWPEKGALTFVIHFLLFPWKARKNILVEDSFQNLVNLKMREFNYFIHAESTQEKLKS